MNNKGFAITGMLYSVLIIFLVLIVTLLFNLQNRKTILDELKADAINAVESENNYEYLLNEINTLKSEVNTLNSNLENSIKFSLLEKNDITSTSYVSKKVNSQTKLINFTLKDNNGTNLVSKMVPKNEFDDFLSSSNYINLKFVLESGDQVFSKIYFTKETNGETYLVYGMVIKSNYVLTISEYE